MCTTCKTIFYNFSLYLSLSLSSSRPEDLMNDIELAAGTPVEHQVIFSSQSDIYISKNSNTSQADFNLFMNRAGGSQVFTYTIHVYNVLICNSANVYKYSVNCQ